MSLRWLHHRLIWRIYCFLNAHQCGTITFILKTRIAHFRLLQEDKIGDYYESLPSYLQTKLFGKFNHHCDAVNIPWFHVCDLFKGPFMIVFGPSILVVFDCHRVVISQYYSQRYHVRAQYMLYFYTLERDLFISFYTFLYIVVIVCLCFTKT